MTEPTRLPALPRMPVTGVSNDLGVAVREVRECPLGVPLASLPAMLGIEDGGILLCKCNGEFLLRVDWQSLTRHNDVIEWYSLAQNRQAARLILTLAVAYFTGGAGGAYAGLTGTSYAVANIAAAFVINAALADRVNAPGTAPQASPTYSTGIQGNRAKMFDAIPKILGRHKITPPFVGDPYTEYDSEGQQFYKALFCIGIGNHRIESAMIDDTPLSHFQDVLTATYLPPGTLPTQVNAKVAVSTEVNGQELKDGLYIGGFSACPANREAVQIGIDMEAPSGLGYSDGSSYLTLTVRWRVYWRPINEFGTATAAWQLLGDTTKSAATSTRQRWTETYDLPTPGRVEIRVVRVDAKLDTPLALHTLVWTGLRAYMNSYPMEINQYAAHYELVMRSSEQLSQFSQANISMVVWALARTWSPGSPSWGPEIETRNPAWHLAELWTSEIWGEGLPDERVDLQTLYDLSLIWDERQDRCDFVVDTRMSAWDLAQLIARTGRARVFRRGPVMTLARDQLDELPVTAFTPRNCTGMSMDERHPHRDDPDGILAEYFDYRSWSWLTVDCPAPGVTEMSAPETKRYAGIVGPTQAKREGLYDAACFTLRTVSLSAKTEMEGILPPYLSTVRWMPEVVGYGQSGDVAFWDADTLVMGLTEPPVFGTSNYLTLVRDDGSLTDPVVVSPGPTQWDVVLPAIPDFTITTTAGDRERTKFLFGDASTGDELVKITRISDGGRTPEGSQLHDLEAIIDDPQVHEVDNAYLPGPGEIQDDVTQAEEIGGDDSTLVLVNLRSTLSITGLSQTGGGDVTADITASYTLGATGGASGAWAGSGGGSSENYSQEWMAFPVEVATAALFEARATLLSSTSNVQGWVETLTGTFDTWLSLGTARTWELVMEPVGTAEAEAIRVIKIEIRDVATETVQDSIIVTLSSVFLNPGS